MTPDKCPKCGAARIDTPWVEWICGNHPDRLRDPENCLLGQRDQLAARVKRLEAESEKLRGWVEDAYDEGYIDGDSTRVTGEWVSSRAKARLEGRSE